MTIPGSAQGHATTEINPEEGLYVPVTNLNYIPEGVGIPQGFVPDHPKEDRVLTRIKDALETQGEVSGEDAVDQKIQQLTDQQEKLTAPGTNDSIDPVTGAPLPTDEDETDTETDETVSPSQPDTEEDTTGTEPQDPKVSPETSSKPLF